MKSLILLCIIFLLAIFYVLWKKQDRNNSGEEEHLYKMGRRHGEGFTIDFYAYSSKIRHWNPAFKVSLSMLSLVLCIVLNNPYVSVAVIIAMGYITIIKGELPIQYYLPILLVQMGFILIGTFTSAIDFSRRPMGQFNLYLGLCYVFTSQVKLKEAAFLVMKVFAAISSLQMMSLSTPSSEIIYVLRKAHIPKIIIELMNMIYRFIFILTDVYTKMKNSAESRHGYCDIKTSYFTFGNIASNMLLISLKKANAYYDAMESRCFDGELIFLQEDRKIETIQIVSASAYILFLIMLWRFTR
ncbi:cobalt ABC transporter, permease protein CbiQ [Clostridiales bacterium oral taxon 876 str. F0540]|nr:cobalt ABC transporter, permease protein CbiQ [Clostridiales bacterium oral taxon 876 str. F0540]